MPRLLPSVTTDKIPHIVKCSGGRSSGMMLLQLLDDDALDAGRGDVVLFNNTSAEHPATYNFVRELKARTEAAGIPFFWLEFQTYEDAHRGRWQRKPTWRLVNDRPYSEHNPDGYHYRGEVFETMMSLNANVPNMQSRVCTQYMKIFPTNAFLMDWFLRQPTIDRLGHVGDAPRMTDAEVLERHEDNDGNVPDDLLLAKKAFVRSQSHQRPAQRFADFTAAPVGWLAADNIGCSVSIYGEQAATFVSFLGIRADEAHRVDKIRLRIDKAGFKQTRSAFSQPPREQVKAPLADVGVGNHEVIEFWQTQDFDLALPTDGLYSNCVYCMMKGKLKIARMIASDKIHDASEGATELTPASVDWWIKMERKYARDLDAEGRDRVNKGVKYIGFFGASSDLAFSALKEEIPQLQAEFLVDESYDICNCTD